MSRKYIIIIPYVLTISRILLTPVYLLFFIDYYSTGNIFYNKVIAFLIFIIASVTDWLDGKIARKYNATSRFGEFVDPLADKILTLTVFFSFTLSPYINVYSVFIYLILGREILITLLRIYAIIKKKVMRTSIYGKAKTVTQIITLMSFLLVVCLHSYIVQSVFSGSYQVNYSDLINYYTSSIGRFLTGTLIYLPQAFLYITVIITIYSGIQYLWYNWQKLIIVKKTNE